MKKHLLTTAIITGLSFFSLPALSAHAQNNEVAQSAITQNIGKKEIGKIKHDAEALIVEDAVKAIEEIEKAQTAIKNKLKISATKHLQAALGKIEAAIAVNPAVSLVPLSQEYITLDTYKTEKQALAARKKAQMFLRKGMVQDARIVLNDLASEIIVSTTSLPLANYANSIKLALPLVTDEKFEEANKILDIANNTLVITDRITPLPIIRMATALETAQKIEADNKQLDAVQRKTVTEMLDFADEQMRLAVALGYARKGDYKDIRKTIGAMRKNVQAKISNTKSYADLIADTKSTNQNLETAQERADKSKSSDKDSK